MYHKNNHSDYRSHSIVSYRFERRAASIVQDLIENRYISGYLKKWSPVIGRGWQNRYFSLLENDRTLVYWKRKPTYKDEQPLGSINLKIVENIFADGPLGITLSTPQRDYQLRASTPTEKDKWMDAIILWTIKSRKYRSKTEDLKNFRFSNMLIESTQSCLNYIFESFLKPYKKSAIRAPEVGPETLSNSNKKKFLKDRGIYYVLYKAWLISKEIRDERRNMNNGGGGNNKGENDKNNYGGQDFNSGFNNNDSSKNITGNNYLCIKDASELNSKSVSMYSIESDIPLCQKLFQQQQNLSLFKTKDGTVMLGCNTDDVDKIPFDNNNDYFRRFLGRIQCDYGSSNFSDVPPRPAASRVLTRSQSRFDSNMEPGYGSQGVLVEKEGFEVLEIISEGNINKSEIKSGSEGKNLSVTWDIDDVFIDYEGDEVMVPISSKYCIYDEGCPLTVEEEEEYSRCKQHKYSLQLTEIMLEQLRTPQKELFLDNCMFGLVYITRKNPEMSSLKNNGIYWGLIISSRSLGEAHHAYPSPVLGERIIFGDSLECYRDVDLGLLLNSKHNNNNCYAQNGNSLEQTGNDPSSQRNKFNRIGSYSLGVNSEKLIDVQVHTLRDDSNTGTCKDNFTLISSGTNNVNSDNVGFTGPSETFSYGTMANYNNINNREAIRTEDSSTLLNDRKVRLKKMPRTFDHRYEINNTLVSSIKSNLINIFPINIGSASGEGNNVGFTSIFRPMGNNQPIDPYGFLLDALYLYHPRNESKNPVYMLDPGKITSIGPISETDRGFTFTVTFMGSSTLEDEIACDLEYINDSPSSVPFCSELATNCSYEYRKVSKYKYHSKFYMPSNIMGGSSRKVKDTNSYFCYNSESQVHLPHVSNSTLTPNSNSNSNSNTILSNFIVNTNSYANGGGGVPSYATAIETLSCLHAQTQNDSNYTKDDYSSIYNNNFQLQSGNYGDLLTESQIADNKRNWDMMSSYNGDRRATIGDGEYCSIGDNSSASNYVSESYPSETLIPITIEFCTRSWRDARAWRYSLIVTRKSKLIDSMSAYSNKKTHPISRSNSSSCSDSVSNHNSSSIPEQKSSTTSRNKVNSGKGRYAHAKSTCIKERQYQYFDSCPTLTTTASSSARTSNGHHLINYRREISNIRVNRYQ
ncbi:pleckstrin domain containing protein [Cryptosporidium ryanae]|uniref:pleckstrin domain containing protein n=1 Tax=Cryptosporidium ryanae TaxID=515981 RepID=UPI00351A0D26|nr:pleckstrin domain containing protein [Cryptosporidium ryanae]